MIIDTTPKAHWTDGFRREVAKVVAHWPVPLLKRCLGIQGPTEAKELILSELQKKEKR